MPTRNDEPPRDDSWDGEFCPRGCGRKVGEDGDKYAPYCGLECETQAIIDMEKEANAYAESIQDEDLNSDIREWQERTRRGTPFTGNRGIE